MDKDVRRRFFTKVSCFSFCWLSNPVTEIAELSPQPRRQPTQGHDSPPASLLFLRISLPPSRYRHQPDHPVESSPTNPTSLQRPGFFICLTFDDRQSLFINLRFKHRAASSQLPHNPRDLSLRSAGIRFCFDARRGRLLSCQPSMFLDDCLPSGCFPRSRFLPTNAREVPLETLPLDTGPLCCFRLLGRDGWLGDASFRSISDNYADDAAGPQAGTAE